MRLENLTIEVQIKFEYGKLPAWLEKLRAEGPDYELHTSIEGIAFPGVICAGLVIPEFEAEEVNHSTWRFPLWFEEGISVGAISIQQVNAITTRLNNESAAQQKEDDLEAAMASDWRYNY